MVFSITSQPLFYETYDYNLCAEDVSQKIDLLRVTKKIDLGGCQDLAVREVSKFKVDVIFITFREFNIMLEIIDS